MVSAVVHRSWVMTYECEQMFTYHDGYMYWRIWTNVAMTAEGTALCFSVSVTNQSYFPSSPEGLDIVWFLLARLGLIQ